MDGFLPARSLWTDVVALAEIPRQGSCVIETRRGEIAVFRTNDDTVFAVEDSCPHKGGKLSQGIVHGHSVTCPLHNWVIGLDDGLAREPDEGCVHRFPVRISRGRVEIDLS